MKRVTMLLAAGFVLLAAASLPVIRAGAQQAVVTDQNVGQMIANAKTSAEHEAIAAFFDNKAAKAEQDAKNHRAWGNIYGKPTMMSHCNRLAQDNQKEADEYKALAAGHREMAKRAGPEAGQ